MPKSEGRRCSWPPGWSGLPGPVGDREATLNRKCQWLSNIQKTYSSLSLLSHRLRQVRNFELTRCWKIEGKRDDMSGSQSGALLAESFLHLWHLCVGCFVLCFFSRERVFLKESALGFRVLFLILVWPLSMKSPYNELFSTIFEK